jgi:hypothetical protein
MKRLMVLCTALPASVRNSGFVASDILYDAFSAYRWRQCSNRTVTHADERCRRE